MRASNIEHRTSNIEVGAGFGFWLIRCWMFAWCILFTAGCARLSPGQLTALDQAGSPKIILIRGYLDWYSKGIDVLASDLRKQGNDAEAFREEQWGDIADRLKTSRGRLILIGFSYGADDVILTSRRLNDAHRPVDLLITIDPVTPVGIPASVKRCVNFYETNGLWDIFPWLRGVPVTADPGATVENINVRSRPDLNEPNTSHATIAGNEKIHRAIEGMVAEIGRSR